MIVACLFICTAKFNEFFSVGWCVCVNMNSLFVSIGDSFKGTHRVFCNSFNRSMRCCWQMSDGMRGNFRGIGRYRNCTRCGRLCCEHRLVLLLYSPYWCRELRSWVKLFTLIPVFRCVNELVGDKELIKTNFCFSMAFPFSTVRVRPFTINLFFASLCISLWSLQHTQTHTVRLPEISVWILSRKKNVQCNPQPLFKRCWTDELQQLTIWNWT